MRFGGRRDHNISETRSKAERPGPIRHGPGEGCDVQVERQNALAIEIFDGVPPLCERLGLAACASRRALAMPARISAEVTTER